MIKFNNVTKIFGKQCALDNINLDIDTGEFIFLVGKSGAGKSTLMRLLYREEKPTAGQVYIGGVNVAKIRSSRIHNLRKCMGIVFQDFKLLPRQSVYDNVAYVIRALGVSTKEVDIRVKGALKVVGLYHKMKAKPTELSGGEQQRVGIARAIVNGPPLLIADEPTGNLDPISSIEVMKILEQVNKKGITVIVSTHDHAIVNHFKKRVITLDQGSIIRDVNSGTYHQ
ncbi:MAG: cell division ATP-binding protein FtsE [Candidatus Gastranaerophilales bacterium]|nr:cell division ATP-binding protein FtsE [Candidatus Gastranaerophilales bacterium]